MKYHVLFRPDSELSDLIQMQGQVTLSAPAIYCELCQFEMPEAGEGRLIGDLRKLHFPAFDVETVRLIELPSYETAIQLTKPDELDRLHREAARTARHYTEDVRGFDDRAKQSYYDHYTPHITIAKNGFDRENPDTLLLLKRVFEVHQVTLAKHNSRPVDIVSLKARNYEHS